MKEESISTNALELPLIKAVLINDTQVDRHHGCSRVVGAIRRLCGANGIEIIGAAPAHEDWRCSGSFMPLFDRAQLVIVNGEGTIHSNRPAGTSLVAAGALAAAAGKRSVLLNFSWFDNNRELAEELAGFDLVAARESVSRAAVADVRPDCRLVPDLSLYGSKASSDLRRGIGFGDSVLPRQSRQLFALRKRHGGRFVPIRYAGRGPGGMLRLARSFLSRRMIADPAALAHLVRLVLGHISNGTEDCEQFVSQLSRLQLFVTGRFHGVSLALCANTPVLAVSSNTGKIEALFSDAGLCSWRLVAPEQIDQALIERASQWEEGEEERVRRYLDSASREAETLFRDIRALV